MIGIVNTQRLNVRDRPAADGRKLGVVNRNAVLPVLAQRNGWYEIRYQQHSGFVSAEYLRIADTSPRQSGVINASRLNVRSRPDRHAPIFGSLVKASVLEIEGSHGDWLEVSFNQATGYVLAEYVDLHLSPEPTQAKVITAVLNVRGQPDAGSTLIGQVVAQQLVSVTGQLDGWSEIVFSKGRGYVASRYLQPLSEQQLEMQQPVAAPVASHSKEQMAVVNAWQKFGPALKLMASEHQLDVATVVAVICVESGGKGFEPSNQDRMIIRFENHKFWKYWGRSNPDIFNAHFVYAKDKVWKGHQWRASRQDPWQSFHGNQEKEWQLLSFARNLDDTAALLSISMGAPQIMGFHYQTLGYATVQQMFAEFCIDVDRQIDGMFAFFSPAMLQSLQQLDFERFAGYYNGSGQKAFYGAAISRHYQAFKQQFS
ncbi:N-acetylmuramidase domain-containing protein [Corallincola spongiicola]|uniref:DUF3380 domain-containing protein n=1 Tax=Corallincola spongiicola TaxID=2520508 RepID=A0ABY1WS08_9GAMM|nr:N-acetylmuramidase domain-containing protein [Corallincola spongiicola]TAA47517.1 DUF3380 domain-containing protein [Corallincola spongiicola]